MQAILRTNFSTFVQQGRELCQSPQGFFQSGVCAGKVQANEMIDWFPKKAGAWHGGDTDVFCHPLAKL